MGCLIPGCGLYSYISILTGTEETTSVDPVKIMLHCTSESLHLFPITGGDFSALTYAIHSMDGTQLLHDRMNEENEVNVATLPSGIYVFTLLHQSGQLIGSAKFWKP